MRNQVIEFRNPDYPWPDGLKIPEPVLEDPIEFEASDEPPSEGDISEENTLMLRQQCLFRWAAQSIAIAMSKLPGVQKVAAFGAVARSLEMEVPRFRQFRRRRIEVLHECADLDLAVWTTGLSALKELKARWVAGYPSCKTRRTEASPITKWMSTSLMAGAENTGDGFAFLASALSRGSASALSQAAGRSRSCSNSKNTRLIPRNLGARRKSLCSTRPADFWCILRGFDAKPTRFVQRAGHENLDDGGAPF